MKFRIRKALWYTVSHLLANDRLRRFLYLAAYIGSAIHSRRIGAVWREDAKTHAGLLYGAKRGRDGLVRTVRNDVLRRSRNNSLLSQYELAIGSPYFGLRLAGCRSD
jgi:hypothetical protein